MSGYDYYRENGVNVKVYNYPNVPGQEILSSDDLELVYDSVILAFWDDLTAKTFDTYGVDVWCEGRSGGWAVFGDGNSEPPDSWIKMVRNLVEHYSKVYYVSVMQDQIDYRNNQRIQLEEGGIPAVTK